MTTHFCLTCSTQHLIHYTASKKHKHLFVECPKGMYAIPFVDGLKIPVKESKRLMREEAKTKQMPLL